MSRDAFKTVRLVRLFKSDKGIWRYEIERDGKIDWSSLRTRSERVARRSYEAMQRALEDGIMK